MPNPNSNYSQGQGTVGLYQIIPKFGQKSQKLKGTRTSVINLPSLELDVASSCILKDDPAGLEVLLESYKRRKEKGTKDCNASPARAGVAHATDFRRICLLRDGDEQKGNLGLLLVQKKKGVRSGQFLGSIIGLE